MKQTRDRQVYIIAAVLAVLTFAAFRQVLKCDFINLDDDLYVTANQHVRAGLTIESIRWALTAVVQSTWQPLIWLSFMLDERLYGLHPLGYHLTNLLFHIANVLLLFFVLRRITGSTWKSAFVAALFAVHPLHVESVAWVTERKDVVSTFFWMLVMWTYARYVEHPTRRRYVPVFAFLAVGLMAKPALVSVPFVLLLLDYWPLRRFQQSGDVSRVVQRLFLEKVPLVALSAVSTVVTYLAQRKGGSIPTLDTLPMAWRIKNALVSCVAYIMKTIWPTKLSVFYPHPMGSLPTWEVIGSLLLLVLVTILVLNARRKQPYLTVGWVWYVGTLLPMIGIVQFGKHGMADRFTYVPLIGIFVMITWGGADVLRRIGVRQHGDTVEEPSRLPVSRVAALSAVSIAVVAALTTVTQAQVGYWRDSGTLFTHAIRVTKNNSLAHTNLGNFLSDRGDLSGAVRECREAIRLDPTDALAHNDLGVALARQGRLDEAKAHFQAALRLNPGFGGAHDNLGALLGDRGDWLGEARECREALRIDPTDRLAHNGLGVALARQGRLEEAKAHFQAALRFDPDFAAARHNLGGLLARARDLRIPTDRYGKTQPTGPDHAMTRRNLGETLIQLHKFDDAVRELRAALSQDPGDADAMYDLGVAQAGLGHIDEATTEFRQALRIRPTYAEAHRDLAQVLFIRGDYAGAWTQVHLCRKYGGKPFPALVEALSAKMRDPGH